MFKEGEGVGTQAPAYESALVWDVTVTHNGKSVRVRLSEKGWRHGSDTRASLLQEEVEKSLG